MIKAKQTLQDIINKLKFERQTILLPRNPRYVNKDQARVAYALEKRLHNTG